MMTKPFPSRLDAEDDFPRTREAPTLGKARWLQRFEAYLLCHRPAMSVAVAASHAVSAHSEGYEREPEEAAADFLWHLEPTGFSNR